MFLSCSAAFALSLFPCLDYWVEFPVSLSSTQKNRRIGQKQAIPISNKELTEKIPDKCELKGNLDSIE